jgi:hypothetical protein
MAEQLVITAHPDDETLWFGGTMLGRPADRWTVVCVTASPEPPVARRRRAELERACGRLGVAELITWDIPDTPLGRLPMEPLRRRLSGLPWDRFAGVWTHGPSGEYGHPHHQDVGYAVHAEALPRGLPVRSPAYHSRADEAAPLPAAAYAAKLGILSTVYAGEFYSFVHLLTGGPAEAFSLVREFAEVEAVYRYYSGVMPLSEARSVIRAAGPPPERLRELSHPWLADEGVSPPCPSQTYLMLATLDETLRRLNPLSGAGASPEPSPGPPERPAAVPEGGGLRRALARLLCGR